ncbi:MAG: group II truncated hemoglobin [Burkholderiales bacterium]|nr:group II truncated hemoglobin [Burkholderiales bacterium]
MSDAARPDAPTGPTPYERLGGETGVRALVDAFYDRMDLEESFAGIRALHAPSLAPARDKLHWYLSGWLGGPSLYVDRFGHPRLRARHLPFPIASSERDQWLACMRLALDDVNAPAELVEPLMQAFFGTADWMRNRPG